MEANLINILRNVNYFYLIISRLDRFMFGSKCLSLIEDMSCEKE